MKPSPFLTLSIALAALLFAAPGHAQEQRPSFNLPQIISPAEVDSVSVDFDEAFAIIDNPYLSDTIKLNYQISLLEKMVTRQTELQKITDSYEAMGVSFNEPAPPRGICAQLPANALCLKHFPDLYDDLVSERRAHYKDLEEKARAALIAANPQAAAEAEAAADPKAAERARKAAAERRARAAAREREQRYLWTEVTCLAGQCHGVLIKPAENGFRATVRKGDRLPDGTVVQSIAASGIGISIDGQAVRVRPAPGTAQDEQGQGGNPLAAAIMASGMGGAVGGGNAFTESNSAAAAVLANAGPSPANAVPPPVPGPGAPPSGALGGGTASDGNPAMNAGAGVGAGAAGQTVSEPPLGPSGLF